MFDFFKRSSGKPVVEQSVRPKRTPAASKPFGSLEPLPLPQVAEGNTDADWSAWEDSVAFQDSQISSFGASSFGAATRPRTYIRAIPCQTTLFPRCINTHPEGV